MIRNGFLSEENCFHTKQGKIMKIKNETHEVLNIMYYFYKSLRSFVIFFAINSFTINFVEANLSSQEHNLNDTSKTFHFQKISLNKISALPSSKSPDDPHKIALVRTFCPDDIQKLYSSFDIWSRLPPCPEASKSENYIADIFLIYSQSFLESIEAVDAVTSAVKKFQETNGWKGCFENIFALDVNITPTMDIYEPSKQTENIYWVNGPNRQFERSIRAIQSGSYGKYDLFYLMEGDSVPVKKFWLDGLMDEIVKSQPFAILGSKYIGDKWDGFYDQLPLPLVRHINGNAVYNISHPLLDILVSRLENEASTPYNTIPYDYRISQIIVEAETGIRAEIPIKIMSNFKQHKRETPKMAYTKLLRSVLQFIRGDPIKTTSIIGNYAATNMVPSQVGEEMIIHGATLYDEWDMNEERITLVVSDWNGVNSSLLLSQLKKCTHPFTDVLVILPADTDFPLHKSRNDSINVTFYRRKTTEPDYLDICNAPVESSWFIMTNSYHRVVRKVTLMIKREGDKIKPVIPFVSANYDNCHKYPSCTKSMKTSKLINHSYNNKYIQDFDMVFNTKERDRFCDFLEKKKQLGNISSSLNVNDYGIYDEPSASAYLAYIYLDNHYQDLYELVDQEKYGSRKIFIQSIPYPNIPEQNATSTNSMISFQRRLMVGVDTRNSTGCNDFDTEDGCVNGGSNCRWRYNFNSCYADFNNVHGDKCSENIQPNESDMHFHFFAMKLNGLKKLSASTKSMWEDVTSHFVLDFLENKYSIDGNIGIETIILCQTIVLDATRRHLKDSSPTRSSSTVFYKQRIVGDDETYRINLRETLLEPFEELSSTTRYINLLKEKGKFGDKTDSIFLVDVYELQTNKSNETNAPITLPSAQPTKSDGNDVHDYNDYFIRVLLVSAVIFVCILFILICSTITWMKISAMRRSSDAIETYRDVEETAVVAINPFYRKWENNAQSELEAVRLNDINTVYDFRGECIDDASNRSSTDIYDELFDDTNETWNEENLSVYCSGNMYQ